MELVRYHPFSHTVRPCKDAANVSITKNSTKSKKKIPLLTYAIQYKYSTHRATFFFVFEMLKKIDRRGSPFSVNEIRNYCNEYTKHRHIIVLFLNHVSFLRLQQKPVLGWCNAKVLLFSWCSKYLWYGSFPVVWTSNQSFFISNISR